MRADGRRIKSLGILNRLEPYFMRRRSDACNSTTIHIPYDPIRKYVRAKKKESIETSAMIVVVAAILRAMSQYPKLNRFVIGNKIYARNEVWVGMVVGREEGMGESTGKFRLELTDTIFDVAGKVNTYVTENRAEDSNDLDGVMGLFKKLSFMLGFIMWLLRTLDRLGWVPKDLIDASPFHNSFVISNLASLGLNPIHHHIYDFGTVGSIFTMGVPEDIAKKSKGEIIMERVLPIGIVCDERICSGAYYAKLFHRIVHYTAHPEELEVPPECVVEDEK